jgi:hypothetical protein
MVEFFFFWDRGTVWGRGERDGAKEENRDGADLIFATKR